MKSLIAILAIATTALAAAPSAQAGESYQPRRVAYCAPAYSHTKQIACRTECRWAKDSCGRRDRYEVRVVTYADSYTDGSRRTYARSFRA